MKYYLGIDVGSISTCIAIIDENNKLIDSIYLRNNGNPVKTLIEGIKTIEQKEISGVGVTGSGRNLTGLVIGADIIKNEITAHSVAAITYYPDVRTIIEIGGQDSKLILLENGNPIDFVMNTVCAAGTGSFLDHQADRIKVTIEEFDKMALNSKSPVRIAGRCGIFAESDMIHKQQVGFKMEDICMGLCKALVRNYLNNLANGKKLDGPILFQGGVSENTAMVKAFEDEVGEIIIPENNKTMGAIGAALLSKKTKKTKFKGYKIDAINTKPVCFYCNKCSNSCEVIKLKEGNKTFYSGDLCGRYSNDTV